MSATSIPIPSSSSGAGSTTSSPHRCPSRWRWCCARDRARLAANPRACLVFPWFPIRRQVVVTGTVTEADDADSDAYWATRPRESQIAGSISEQSTVIPDRAWLERRFAEAEARFADGPVPRPAHWGMHRLRPATIELWTHRDHRMHDRLLYERD